MNKFPVFFAMAVNNYGYFALNHSGVADKHLIYVWENDEIVHVETPDVL